MRRVHVLENGCGESCGDGDQGEDEEEGGCGEKKGLCGHGEIVREIDLLSTARAGCRSGTISGAFRATHGGSVGEEGDRDLDGDTRSRKEKRVVVESVDFSETAHRVRDTPAVKKITYRGRRTGSIYRPQWTKMMMIMIIIILSHRKDFLGVY